jgi:hypothetical protein
MTAPLFDAVVMAEMRAFNRANLPFLASVSNLQEVDSGDRSIEEVDQHEFDTPCRLAPMVNSTAREGLSADALVAVNRWNIVFMHGTNVKAQSTVIVSGKIDGIFFSRKFRVLGEQGPRTNEMERSVIAEEIQDA